MSVLTPKQQIQFEKLYNTPMSREDLRRKFDLNMYQYRKLVNETGIKSKKMTNLEYTIKQMNDRKEKKLVSNQPVKKRGRQKKDNDKQMVDKLSTRKQSKLKQSSMNEQLSLTLENTEVIQPKPKRQYKKRQPKTLEEQINTDETTYDVITESLSTNDNDVENIILEYVDDMTLLERFNNPKKIIK